MSDPPRLRSEAAGLEGLLLRSSRDFEPPASAEEEVWRRVQIVTAAGAVAGATGLAASTAAAGSKVLGKTLWLSVLKWSAVVALGVPAAGVATRWVVHREATSNAQVASTSKSEPLAKTMASAAPPVESTPSMPVVVPPGMPTVTATTAIAPVAPLDVRSTPRVHGGASGASAPPKDVPSALNRESRSLGAARAKFAAGDPRGALDDATRLGVDFPHGRLAQEREVLAIDCLAALGDGEGTRARATAFVHRFAQSPYLAHVRQVGHLDER
jgi:hypothetical protein